jgi:hypothetical protein
MKKIKEQLHLQSKATETRKQGGTFTRLVVGVSGERFVRFCGVQEDTKREMHRDTVIAADW